MACERPPAAFGETRAKRARGSLTRHPKACSYGSEYTYNDSFLVVSGSVMPPPPDPVIATYCLPLASYVIGTAIALLSSFVTQSSFPVFASNARNRLSFVAPLNTTPPAVAIDPPILILPVFFFPSGSSSVMPNTTCQTISPVFALIAVNCPHGGFWHGQLCSPRS